MPPSIKISVIIPAHNAAGSIAQTLQSLQHQTYPHWEAIVVDDGSVDDTAALVRSLAEHDHRIRIYSQTNQGAAAARNTGIRLAKYDWLVFLDADDTLNKHYLQRMAEAAESNPAADAIRCGWVRVAPDGRHLAKPQLPEPAEDLFPLCARQCPFAIHACMVRKQTVEAAGIFDTSLRTSEDWDLWQRIARMGTRFGSVPEVLAFYHVHPGSLSKDAIQAFQDALRVLTQGHGPDTRLPNCPGQYQNGLPAHDLPALQLYLLVWFAGSLLGQQKDPHPLFRLLKKQGEIPADPYWVAHSLSDAITSANNQPITNWSAYWKQMEDVVHCFLQALEQHTGMQNLAKRTTKTLEQMIVQQAAQKPLTIGNTHAIRLEIAEPIPSVTIPQPSVDRLYCFVEMEGKEIGHLELPVCDGLVPSWVLQDALAARFAWQVLGRFFEHTVYKKSGEATAQPAACFEELHNESGWTIFLQQLWNRPGWQDKQFYDPNEATKKAAPIKEAIAVPSRMELSEELPDVRTDTGELTTYITIGGSGFCRIQMPAPNKVVRAQQLRAYITETGNYELCVACVREALIGRPLTEPLPLYQRLQQAAEKAASFTAANTLLQGTPYGNGWFTAETILLGRRPGLIGTNASRRAILPAAAASDLLDMAKATGETVVQTVEAPFVPKHIFYVPEAIAASVKHQLPEAIEATTNATGSLYDREHFESLFSQQPDPWKYTHPYEQTKYELTLSLIPPEAGKNALEIACAEGHFTVQLAPLVKRLLAVDIAQVALQRAAERCRQFTHIQYRHFDLIKDELPEQFDLIVCSEVLYYVGGLPQLKAVAKKFAQALLPGGYLVMAHAHQVVDDPNHPGFDWGLPFGAKVIGETFARSPQLRLVKEIRTPLYRVQLFQRTQKPLFSLFGKKPEISILPQPSPIPPEVEASVRWQGGKPSSVQVSAPIVTKRLPILMYHRVAPTGSGALNRYRVFAAQFEEQLRYLRDSGYHTVPLTRWLQAMVTRTPLPGKAIVLTFDDGYQDFYDDAWPLLRKYGFSATVFLVSDCIGKTNIWDAHYGEEVPLMGTNEIRELYRQGVEFGAHAASHPFLTTLSPAEVVREGARSRAALEQLLNVPVTTFAYPYGDSNASIEHLIGACGFNAAVTCKPGFATLRDDALSLPRIEIKGSDSLQEFVRKIS